MSNKLVSKFDTAVTVRIKRQNQTCFIITDGYETVQTLKGRYLAFL